MPAWLWLIYSRQYVCPFSRASRRVSTTCSSHLNQSSVCHRTLSLTAIDPNSSWYHDINTKRSSHSPATRRSASYPPFLKSKMFTSQCSMFWTVAKSIFSTAIRAIRTQQMEILICKPQQLLYDLLECNGLEQLIHPKIRKSHRRTMIWVWKQF